VQQQKQDHFLHTFVSLLIRNSLFKTVKDINVAEETIKSVIFFYFFLFAGLSLLGFCDVACTLSL